MNDPQNLGLSELGQRVQAMADPVPDSRLRPYQGTMQTPASNGHSNPSLEPYEHSQAMPAQQASTATSIPSPVPYTQQPYSPPYSPQIPGQFAAQSQAQKPVAYSNNSTPIREQLSPWETFPQPDPSQATPIQSRQVQSAPSTPSASTQPQASQPSSPASAAPVDPNAPKSGIQRALDAIRSTIPLVQKLLPLIDGNIATAVGALVATHVHPAPPPPQVHVDLEPVERGLAEVRNSHRELRNQVAEHAASFKRVEDQLEHVREATDRNTLEQQELVEDLRAVGSRVSTFAIVGLVLLLLSLGLNIFLIFQLQHILR